MITKFGQKNLTAITHNKLQILISYSTPVAVWDGSTLFRTEQRYSVTTSKHINFYLNTLLKAGHKVEVVTVPQRVIDDARYTGTVQLKNGETVTIH